MNLLYAGTTHVGMKRTHNEDSLKLVPKEKLFVVADGMGGHSSGEVASRIAVDTIGEFFEDTARDKELTWPFKGDKALGYEENRLVAGVKLANLRIFEQAMSDLRFKGMGTTIVTLQFLDDELVVGHVGDSRAYRVRNGALDQLTEDHSLLNDYKKMTAMTPEEEKNFPHKNIIVRALGMKETVQVDTHREKPEQSDIYLLCSDGLSGEVPDPQILEIVTRERGDLKTCCDALIRAACENGGKDNVTAILIEVVA